MHVLVTRPETDAAAFGEKLEALGHKVTIEPLLLVETLPIEISALDGVAGVVVTSRNGVRALADSPAFQAARQLPLFAVGPGTAELARSLGFEAVTAGAGSGAELVPIIADAIGAGGAPLLHVRGEDIAFDLKGALADRGIAVRESLAYRTRTAETLTAGTRDLLGAGEIDAVILMSPRTGSTFTHLIAEAGLLDRARKLVLLCLSPAVAATVEPLAPARVEIAESPNAASMLGSVTRVATLWSGV